jgi:ABC-type Fe3+-hydroxamate transport system substrate-binding protein
MHHQPSTPNYHLFLPMALFTDQTGREIELHGIPRRIISLVPSQTELLYDLGLDEKVAGITRFCVHPAHWFRNKTRIGGTKQLHIDKIRQLKPDLILANKEENLQEEVEDLARDIPVWVSDVGNLEDAFEMILGIGIMTAKEAEAEKINTRIRSGFSMLYTGPRKPRTAYLIWREPYMTIGGDTFIHDMVHRAGFENIFGQQSRYPEMDLPGLREKDCELVLLSSEPYPFRQKHVEEIGSQLPGIKILLVDGEMFSWYGSRLIKAPAYFSELQIQVLSLNHAGSP